MSATFEMLNEDGVDDRVIFDIWGAGVVVKVSCPHVHVHLLTQDEELPLLGVAIHEFACHACGASILATASAGPGGISERDSEALSDKFRTFWAAHGACLSGKARAIRAQEVLSVILGTSSDESLVCPGVCTHPPSETLDLTSRPVAVN